MKGEVSITTELRQPQAGIGGFFVNDTFHWPPKESSGMLKFAWAHARLRLINGPENANVNLSELT